MPIPVQSPEDLDAIKSSGLDPAQYYFDAAGQIRNRAQTVAEAPETSDTSTSAGVKSALYNVPEAIGGAAGAGGALWAAGALGAPETGGLSLLIPAVASLIGAGVGSAGAGKVKKALLPESMIQAQARREEEHPTASRVGEIASQVSVSNPLKSVKNLVDVAREIPTLSRGLSPRAMKIVANQAINAGTGAGVSVGRDLYEGKDVDLGEAALQAGTGALFSEPNTLGKIASFGQFHSTPEAVDRFAGAKEAANTPDAEVKKEPTHDPVLVQALDDTGLANRFGAETLEDKIGLLNQLKDAAGIPEKRRAGEIKKLDAQIEQTKTKLKLAPTEVEGTELYKQVDDLTRQRDILAGADTLLRHVTEARNSTIGMDDQAMNHPGATEEVPTGPKGTPTPAVDPTLDPRAEAQAHFAEKNAEKLSESQRRQADFEKAKQELADQQAAEAKQAELAANPPRDNTANELTQALQANAIKGNPEQPRSQVTKFSRPENVGPDRTLPQAEERTQADIDQARLEGVRERYQGDEEKTQKATKAWNDLMAGVAKREFGAETKTGADIGANRGRVTTAPDVAPLIELSQHASPDTAPHEMIHLLLDDLKAQGGRTAKRAEALERASGGEEAATQAGGEHMVKRIMGDDSLRKDLMALVKHWIGTATAEDYARLVSNTLKRGNIGGEGGKVQVRNQPFRPRGADEGLMEYAKAKREAGLMPEKSPYVQSIEQLQEKLVELKTKFDLARKQGNDGYAIELRSEINKAEQFIKYQLDNPRIRNQGPADVKDLGLPPQTPEKTKFNIFSSVTDRLRQSGDKVKGYMADKFEELFNNNRAETARNSQLLAPLRSARPEDVNTVYKILLNEDRSGQSRAAVVRPDLKPLYNTMRNAYKTMRETQIAEGGTNRDGSKLGMDPTGMFNILDVNTMKALTSAERGPEWQKLKDDFVALNSQRGMTKEQATEAFNKYLGRINGGGKLGDNFNFKAVDTRENTKLPDSWIEPDGMKAWNRYVARFSKARAWQKTIEADPEMAKALGLGEDVSESRAGDPLVKQVLSFFAGNQNSKDEKFIASVSRLVSSSILGPSTRLIDMATTPIKALSYMSPSAIPGYIAALKNVRQGYDNSFKTGLNRPGGHAFVSDVLGAGAETTSKIDAASRLINKWNGSESMEVGSRALAQLSGEYIAKHQLAMAESGSPTAKDFLAKLQITPGMDPAEAGTRVAQLLQGKYDVTNLPDWAFNSPVAPFVSMMRWNVEQWNNFNKFAIEPAIKHHNLTPALMTIFAGLTGGVGINLFKEALSGRKDYHATFDEINKAPDKGRAMQELASKLAYLAQLTGTVGVVGELGSQLLDVGTGKLPRGVSYPALSVGADMFTRVAAAAKGIGDGEDPMKVIPAVLNDIARNNVQVYRLVDNGLLQESEPKKIGDANLTRDKTVYDNLSGQPRRLGFAATPNYSNVSAKKFAEEQDPSRLPAEAQALIRRGVEQGAGNHELMEKRLEAFKPQAPSYVPNPMREPRRFAEYVNYITKTQGPEAAAHLIESYQKDRAQARAKAAMIP